MYRSVLWSSLSHWVLANSSCCSLVYNRFLLLLLNMVSKVSPACCCCPVGLTVMARLMIGWSHFCSCRVALKSWKNSLPSTRSCDRIFLPFLHLVI